MLGSTQTVDLETTRKDYGPIFVVVWNPKLIPTHFNGVIGNHYIGVHFEVEKEALMRMGNKWMWIGRAMMKEKMGARRVRILRRMISCMKI